MAGREIHKRLSLGSANPEYQGTEEPIPHFFKQKHSHPLHNAAPIPPISFPKPSLQDPLHAPMEAGSSSAQKKTELGQRGVFKRATEQHEGERRTKISNYVDEGFAIKMNKLSLVGLIFSLIFLGVLFFVIGFLVASMVLYPDDGKHVVSQEDSYTYSGSTKQL